MVVYAPVSKRMVVCLAVSTRPQRHVGCAVRQKGSWSHCLKRLSRNSIWHTPIVAEVGEWEEGEGGGEGERHGRGWGSTSVQEELDTRRVAPSMSTQHPHEQRRVMYSRNPSLGEMKTDRALGLLPSQCSWIVKLQVQWDLASENRRRAAEGDTQCWPLAFINTCDYGLQRN